MNILIVYDSFFGNTEKIAQVMKEALDSEEQVELIHVKDIKPEHLIRLKLLIVGSPTRGFKATPAINTFLNSIPPKGLKGINVTAFDTRISTTDVNSRVLNVLVKMFGYAAEPMAAKLVKKSGSLIIQPEGFIVKDSEGPLKEGEIERACRWVRQAVSSS